MLRSDDSVVCEMDVMPTQPAGTFNEYQAYLVLRRAEIATAISKRCQQQVAFYANLDISELKSAAEQILGTLFEALVQGAESHFFSTFTNTIERRIQDGLDVDDALRVPIAYRHEIRLISMQAIQEHVAQAESGMPVLLELLDVVEIRIVERYRQHLRRLEALVGNSLDGVMVYDTQSQITYANQALAHFTGYPKPANLIGTAIENLVALDEHHRFVEEISPALAASGGWQGQIWALRVDGSRWLAQASVFRLVTGAGETAGNGVILRDVTETARAAQDRLRLLLDLETQAAELKQAQQEREALQEEVISAQEAAIRELSTPLIPLADGVVAMPLVGTISTARAQQIMETLLEGIGTHQAHVALIDITGVKVVDTQVADALLRAARAARLLGAQVVLTGIGAEIAQTLVSLGADMTGITTRGTLREGIAFGMADGNANR